jgi:hypothetical protein
MGNITIEIPKNEVPGVLNALNHAIISYKKTCFAAQMGALDNIPKKLRPLFEEKDFQEFDDLVKEDMTNLLTLYAMIEIFDKKEKF